MRKLQESIYSPGASIAYESSGDFLRWNPHFHSLILEGGFDEEGNFAKLQNTIPFFVKTLNFLILYSSLPK